MQPERFNYVHISAGFRKHGGKVKIPLHVTLKGYTEEFKIRNFRDDGAIKGNRGRVTVRATKSNRLTFI